MALRWVRTIDESPHMFSTREAADNDWLLYCGAWQVGRLHEELRPAGAQRIVFGWSLTGPHTPEAPVAKRGEAASVAVAKQQLVNAMRAWAVWAGVRTADGGAPVAPRWVLTKDHRPELLGRAEDPTTNWLLLSGGFMAGHVHRPAAGLRQDPHWMLLGTSSTDCPGPRAGWAESIEEAKADLLNAWLAWLEWAELGASRSTG
jgi:hypothetical protein